ncbi:MAG: hypothetical protein K2I22_02525 [Lachnospiraceae bacterium]|nr:hypothetical protein [Lachnospiraceae bacterium]
MSIETYADIMMKFYMGLFLLSVFAGAAAIRRKIRKKTLKYWWLIPCTILYSIVAVFNVFIAFIAYDDPADPNYRIYKNWELKDFILNDIKVLIIWLFIVAVLYLVLRRKECKTSAKTGGKKALIFLAVLLTGAVILILFTVTISPKREKEYITIHVEGFDVTYPIRGEKITMEAVSDIELGSSGIEIGDKLGEPDAFIGSGMLRPVYFVEGNQVVVLHFTYPAAWEDLRQIVLVDENGESRILKEKESGNVEASAELCTYTEELLEIEWSDCMESAAGDVVESEYYEEVAQIKLEVKQGYEEEVINILQNRFIIPSEAPPLPKSEFSEEIENGDVRYVFSVFMEGKRAKTREIIAYVVYDESGKMYVYIMG